MKVLKLVPIIGLVLCIKETATVEIPITIFNDSKVTTTSQPPTTSVSISTKEVDLTTQEVDPSIQPLKQVDQTTQASKKFDQTTQPSIESTDEPTILPTDLKSRDIVTTQLSMEDTLQPQAIVNNTSDVTSQPSYLGATETTQPITDIAPGIPQTTEVVPETTEISSEKDHRRPLYVVGHMTNSLDEIKSMLDKGANSLECDLNFDRSGAPTYMFHGYLCDLGRICDSSEKFDLYMETIANITTPSNIRYRRRLVLLYIDLKLHNLDTMHMEIAGEYLAGKVVHHLGWRKNVKPEERSIVNVLFSIEYPSFHPVFFGLKKGLKNLLSDEMYNKHVGWSFDGDGFPELTAAAVWKAVGIEKNIWRGYGAPNMFAFLVGDGILDDAVCNREQASIPAKIARWTVDSPIDIRSLLRKSLDAVITNFPQVARLVLRDEEFASKYRLATIEDSPWEKYVDPNNVSKLCKRDSIFKFFGQILDI